MRKNFVFVLILAAFLYAVLWFGLAYPYQLFPSDDTRILSEPWGLYSYTPVFGGTFAALKWFWMLFSNDATQLILLFNIVPNSITLLFLVLIVFKLTKRIIPTVLAGVLFATSLWPAIYYFMAHYVAFSVALSTVVLWCLISAFLNKEKSKKYLLIASLFFLLFFLSSPVAPLLIFLEVLIVFYLFAPAFPLIRKLRKIFLIAFPIFVVAFLVLYSSLPGMLAIRDRLRGLSYIDHLLRNVHVTTNQYYHFHEYVGYTPPVAKLSFFKIGLYYAPVIFWSFIILSFLFALLVIVKKKYTSQTKIIFCLLFLAYAHALAIDFLPFTKLGRVHFVLYPLVIVSLVVLADYFFENYFKKRDKNFAAVILLLMFLYAIYGNISGVKELIRVKHYPGNVLSALTYDAKTYMLKSDIHAGFIEKWLNTKINLVDNFEGVDRGVFIIGPYGQGSGRSIMSRSELPDFDFDSKNIEKPEKAVEVKLPYYVYYPPFLFEETLSEWLYFDGGSPDYNLPDKQLTVWELK